MSTEEWSIQEFRALHACIAQGSITGGARQVGKSQPAVSRAIANLEYKLGVRLFERSGKSIIATEEAILINTETSPFFLLLDQLRERGVSRQSPMTLKIASPPNFSCGFIQSAIASFIKIHQNVRVELEVLPSHLVNDKVAKDEVDIGISDQLMDTHNVIREPFGYSTMACFLHKQHHLSKKSSIRVADLKDVPLIGLSKSHSARAKLERLFRGLNFKPNFVVETNTSVSAMSFVANGVGIALMSPFPLASNMSSDIVLIPFESTIQYSPAFILSTKRGVKKSTRWFLSHLKKEMLGNIYLTDERIK